MTALSKPLRICRPIGVAALALACAALLPLRAADAQEVQRLYKGKAPGSETWAYPEIERTSPDGGKSYGNVVDPEYIAYLPQASKANGTGIILLPGGGLRQLGVGREANAMIQRFNAEGIAVFVLKHRILQIPPRPAEAPASAAPAGPRPPIKFPKLEIRKANANPSPNDRALTNVLDLATEDAKVALRMIRAQAAKYRIDPHRIGMVGSSAGGGVAFAALLRRGGEEGPAFIGSLYGPSLIDVTVPADAPPLFIATETAHGPVTDGLVALFTLWKDAGRPVELHVFDVPNFAMSANLWIDRFMDWMREQKLIPVPAAARR